jgi:transposase
VQLWSRKRRLRCLQDACPQGSFTQTDAAIPPRSRLTARLREHLACAVAGSNRAVDEVARGHGVSWPTVHRALVAAVGWLPPPEPAAVVGIDETRARSVRWVLEPAGWRRNDPWADLNADTTGPACCWAWPRTHRGLREDLAGRADTGLP